MDPISIGPDGVLCAARSSIDCPLGTARGETRDGNVALAVHRAGVGAIVVNPGSGHRRLSVNGIGCRGVEGLLHGSRGIQVREGPSNGESATSNGRAVDAIVRRGKRAARAVAKISERTSAAAETEQGP